MSNHKFWQFEESNAGADVYLYEDIEDCAGDFVKQLGVLQSGDSLTVHINSDGGYVSEGVAIYNALRALSAQGVHVTTICEGMACSIASVIFMAGDERIMRRASDLMIHNAWSTTTGNAAEMRKQAADLDKITQLSKSIYIERSGIDSDTLTAFMDAETLLDASQAVEYGFATSVDDSLTYDKSPAQSARAIISRLLTERSGAKSEVIKTHTKQSVDAGTVNAIIAALTAVISDSGECEPTDEPMDACEDDDKDKQATDEPKTDEPSTDDKQPTDDGPAPDDAGTGAGSDDGADGGTADDSTEDDEKKPTASERAAAFFQAFAN